MRITTLPFFYLLLLFSFAARAADTNPPPRLTVELRDGSRVVGTSAEKNFKFHSALLGDLKLEVKDIRQVECLSSNSTKLTTTGGDVLTVWFADSQFAVNTSFGKVELAADSVHKFTVAATRANGTIVQAWSGCGRVKMTAGIRWAATMPN